MLSQSLHTIIKVYAVVIWPVVLYVCKTQSVDLNKEFEGTWELNAEENISTLEEITGG